jgi:hypothetical protein
MLDPTGEAQREDQAKCGKPGIEFASYAYDKGNNKLSLSGYTYNTNGCVGFSDVEGSTNFAISSDGTTAKLEKSGEAPITLYRVSK